MQRHAACPPPSLEVQGGTDGMGIFQSRIGNWAGGCHDYAHLHCLIMP